MSDLQLDCPGCGEHLSVDDEYAGEEIECPSCSEAMIVPEPEPLVVTPIREVSSRKPPAKSSRGFPVGLVATLIVFALAAVTSAVLIRQKQAAKQRTEITDYRTTLASVTSAIGKESAQCAKACAQIANEWERFETHSAGRAQIVSLEDRLAKIIKKQADALTSYKSALDADAQDLRPPSKDYERIHKRFEAYYAAYEKLYQATQATSGTREDYVGNVKALQSTLDTIEAEMSAFLNRPAS